MSLVKPSSFLIYCDNEKYNPFCEEYFKNKNNMPVFFNDDINVELLNDNGWEKDDFGNWYCKSCSLKQKNIKGKK